jgi:hypothetical protein
MTGGGVSAGEVGELPVAAAILFAYYSSAP